MTTGDDDPNREAAGVDAERAASGAVSRRAGEPIGPGARAEVREALDRLQELFREVRDVDSTRIIREMRDERTERDARLG
jgi:hypothetical protein